MRDTTFVGTTTMVTEECYNCGMMWAMTQDFRQQCLDAPREKPMYCPAGHRQYYQGDSNETKLKKRLANTQEEVNRERSWRHEAESRTETVMKQRNAFKGHLGRTKTAIAGGKCPCCGRNFQNLQRHMSGQHPDYK